MSENVIHVYPENDWQEHLTYGWPLFVCKCNPRVHADEYGALVIHNSFDGREVAEHLDELKGSGEVKQ